MEKNPEQDLNKAEEAQVQASETEQTIETEQVEAASELEPELVEDLVKKRRRRSRSGGKKIKELEEQLVKLTEELAEAKDKYLRLFAEFDNYRRRTLREREDLVKTAAQSSIKAILPSLDDFERAMRAAKENQGEAVPAGIVLIYEKLLRSLEAQGLRAMESTGAVFDVDLHEALTKIPAPNEDLKGKVLDTVERGYYLNDKIIRYAKVVVAQ